MDVNSYILTIYTVIYLRLISAGVLQNLVDVKGNNGIKQIRILYYEQLTQTPNIPTIYPLIRGLPLFAEIDFMPRYIPQLTYHVAVTVALPEKIRSKQWILGWHQEVFQLPNCRLCTNTNQSYTMPVTLYLSDDGWCAEIINAGVLNNLIDIKGNNAIKEVRILYQEPNPENIPMVYPLIRGLPLFAEIDFVPRYIPKFTHYVGVTVALPENVKTKQWIIGYHQEEFQIPKCRLCTNTNQSYTMPVTIYLADDGWCAQGRVPTLWKVEAIPLNRRYNDQTDMIIGLAYDKDKQIRIFNSNRTYHCYNKNEAIVY